LALAEMAHASGRRGLWNERLRRPAYRILARARVGGKANMPPPRQAASAADRAICARIFTAIDRSSGSGTLPPPLASLPR
jgi:hypothetical protein